MEPHARPASSWCVFGLLAAGVLWPATTQAAGGEEFVGPFPSWRDLRRDYGAVGDGKSDDTAALQRALDDLVQHRWSCVLYVPAGTYRLTRTVQTVRKAHSDCQGVSILGEDPARTILRWDGPKDGTMFQWDAWYARIGRLTFDGAGRAGIGLFYGPSFSTYNETSDLVFRDCKSGIVFGSPDTKGQAENEVLRCQFLRCRTGIQTVNWNSMDIWVWYCKFEDCDRGIYNVMGNWHAWHNLFLRSKTADVATMNLMAFSVVNNTSIGSRRFFDFQSGHSWGSPASVTGNRVFDATGDWAIYLDNAGPYLVVDNVLPTRGKARGVRMTWADQSLVGNTYTRPDAVEERGRFRRIAERVVPAEQIATDPPTLPETPMRCSRPVIEVRSGADGEIIQLALRQAVQLKGQRPIVHLPTGVYPVRHTLYVAAGLDVQIVGDGAGETATRLNWAGPPGGAVFTLQGPSRATMRDLYIHAPTGRALVVEKADQPGGRIFADQLQASGPNDQGNGRTAAIRVNGLDQTDVLFRALQGNGNGGAWIEIMGGPQSATATNQVSIFTGATGSAASQYDVWSGGRLVVRGVYHERSSASLTGLFLTDHGSLSIDATRFSYATSPRAPTVAVESFHGLFTLATCILLPVETQETCRFELRGDGSETSALALNDQFVVSRSGAAADTVWLNRTKPLSKGGLIGCNLNTSNQAVAKSGFAFLENLGDRPAGRQSRPSDPIPPDRSTVDDATILRHLAPLRSARVWLPADAAEGATDVRLYRILASGGPGATVEFKSGP